MAKDKFQVLRERSLGKISKKLARKWASIAERHVQLAIKQEELREEMLGLEKEFGKIVPPDYRTTSHEGYRLDPDGTLFQVLCTCIECQASLQKLPIVLVTERMIQARLVPPDKADAARAHAAELSQKEAKDQRRRMLYN
jgi:hypothetical protein